MDIVRREEIISRGGLCYNGENCDMARDAAARLLRDE